MNNLEEFVLESGYVLGYVDKEDKFAFFETSDETAICLSPYPDHPTHWQFFIRGTTDMDTVPSANGVESLRTFLNYLAEDSSLGEPK